MEYKGTTAGWKNSFAYEKLLQILIQQIIEPNEAFVLGGTWRIPVLEKLLRRSFIDELKLDETYNEASFAREYESEWSGDAENASKSAYYVLGVDVGRKGCTTEIAVIKVTPQPGASSIKSLVNIYTYDAEHFEEQAIKIKQLYYKYKASMISIDANGLGVGLIDFMVKSQVDPDTGETLPDFGVYGGTYEGAGQEYKKFKTPDTEQDAMYLIKANAPINTEMYSYVQSQIMNGKVKFLIDEQTAKVTLMSKKVGQEMTPEKRNEYLIPFQQTTILREQMLNLVEENEGVNIILKQDTRSILKDKFSAFGYGMYYIKLDDSKRNKRKSRNISDFMFFS